MKKEKKNNVPPSVKKVLKDQQKAYDLIRRIEKATNALDSIRLKDTNLTRYQHEVIKYSLENLNECLGEFLFDMEG